MRAFRRTTVGLALLLLGLAGIGASPASAACADDIAALQKQVEAKAHQAVAANSGGQADAAAIGGQADAAKKAGTPVGALPAPDGTEATEAKAAAAGGSDGAMKAKVILNDAKVAQGKGDEKACLDAVRRAKDQLKG